MVRWLQSLAPYNHASSQIPHSKLSSLGAKRLRSFCLAYKDLRDWIGTLDRAGELKRIRTEVDPVLEVTEIADRVSKGAAKKYGRPGGPALLFENVKGAN